MTCSTHSACVNFPEVLMTQIFSLNLSEGRMNIYRMNVTKFKGEKILPGISKAVRGNLTYIRNPKIPFLSKFAQWKNPLMKHS